MATHLKRGENFNSNIIADCRQSVTVKNIKIGRSLANIAYGQTFGGTFLWTTVYNSNNNNNNSNIGVKIFY